MPNQQNTGPGTDAIRTRGSVAASSTASASTSPTSGGPRAATLKAIEAAGFGWVQVAAPPVEMLADPRHGVRHATRAAPGARGDVAERRRARPDEPAARQRAALPRVRGPARVRAPRSAPRHVVYHALDFARRGSESTRGGAARCAGWPARPRRSGVTVCLENLCPVYPGPLERLPRPAVGARPRAPARHAGLRDAARRRARERRRRLHGRRDRDADRAGARRRARSSTCTTTSARASRGEGGPDDRPPATRPPPTPGRRQRPLGPASRGAHRATTRR